MAEQSFSIININTNKKISFYTQGQQLAARVLFILWLLASSSPEGVFAVPQSRTAIEQLPTSTHGEQDLPGSPASVLSSNVASTSPKVEQLPTSTYGEQGFPDSPASVSSSKVASTSPETDQALKAHYQKRFFEVPSLFPEDPRTPMDQIQGHLMLIEQVQEAAPEGKENQLMAIHKRIECRKGPIALCDLFKKRSIEPDGPIQEISKVLVIGEAGTGKTTLAQKLAYDWAQGTWGQELTAVYLLPVCALEQDHYNGDSLQTAPTLATAIVRECFPALHWYKNEDFKRLRDQVQKELEHPTTLVILDGLNERAGAQEEILSEAGRGRHKLLMLSRPYGIAHECEQVAEIEIEHQGFDDAQMDAYVQRYFQKQKLGEDETPSAETLSAELVRFIKKYSVPAGISHVPMNLKILCALWLKDRKGVREATMQGSLAGLYGRLTGYMWQRFLEGYQNDQQYQSQVAEDRESLFISLGNIALNSMEQGSVLIGEQQVQDALGSSIREEMLGKNGLLQAAGLGQYQFPHLTFQEYFAGCTLAKNFLSKEAYEQKRVSDFLAEHKYKPQYGRTLSFMAGELSRVRGLKGIQQLLRLLEQEQEVVGLQHLLLQLRVIHEWLCIASDQEATRGMKDLEKKFQVMACLKEGFCIGLEQVRLWGPGPSSPGGKILGLLTDSLQVSSSVLRQAPGVLDLLQQYAKWKKKDVLGGYATSQAAVETLGQVISAVPKDSGKILEILCTAAQDKHYSVRQAALKAFGQAISAFPEESEKILNTLQKAVQEAVQEAVQAVIKKFVTTKNTEWQVLQTAPSLAESISAISEESEAILKILQKAAKNPGCEVRQAAVKALGEIIVAVTQELEAILKTLRTATSDQSAVEALGRSISVIYQESAILKTLCAATKDPDCEVCQAAVEAPGKAISVVPEESSAILEILFTTANDEWHTVRQAAVEALGEIISVVPEKSSAILEILQEAAKDLDFEVCQAAVEALGKAILVVPEESSAILEILSTAAQSEHCDIRQAAIKALGRSTLALLQEQERSILARPQERELILSILRTAANDEWHTVRQAAVEALGKIISVVPEESSAILEILRAAAKDLEYDVRQAAVEALGKAILVVPQESSAILEILQEAAKDLEYDVRQAAVEALGEIISVVSEKSSAILEILQEAAEDADCDVCQAAVEALGKAILVVPQESSAILKILRTAAAESKHCDIRQAAIKALGRSTLALLQEWESILLILCTAAKDKWDTIRQAAVEALGEIISVVPEESSAILKILQKAAKDLDCDVRQAAVEALGKAISVAPQKNTILGALHKVAKDAACKCLQRVFAFIGRAISPFPSELGAILHTLCTAANDERYTVRQAAIQALARVPIEQLIDAYWATNEDGRLVPIAHRLYERSLVITSSEAKLYRAEGKCRIWQESTKDLEHFAKLIKSQASQMIIMQSLKTVPQRPQDYDRWLGRIRGFGLGDHPEVASVLRMVAMAYHDVGQYEESVHYFEQALAMQQVLHKGKKHDDVAAALIDTGIVSERLDNYEEAFEYYQQAFQMYVGLHKGKSHDDIAKALNYMGVVCERLNEYDEALSYYQQALEIQKTLHKGENHDDVAKAFFAVGFAYGCLKDLEKAIKYLQQALNVPSASPATKQNAGYNLGCLYRVRALAATQQDNEQQVQMLLKEAIKHYEQALAVPAVSQDMKASIGYNLGCRYHEASLVGRQAGDEQQEQAYLEKANTNFEQAVQANDGVEAGLYTEYGNFLLYTGKAAQAHNYLHQAIESGDSKSGLSYDLTAQGTVTPVLQAYIGEQDKVSLRGIDYAYYLMILHYDDFQKAGITMTQTREAYLAAYQASLDQRTNQPRQARVDKIAYFLLASLYKAQGDQEAADAALARTLGSPEQQSTQNAA